MMGHVLVVIFGDQCWGLNNDEGVIATLYNRLICGGLVMQASFREQARHNKKVIS